MRRVVIDKGCDNGLYQIFRRGIVISLIVSFNSVAWSINRLCLYDPNVLYIVSDSVCTRMCVWHVTDV